MLSSSLIFPPRTASRPPGPPRARGRRRRTRARSRARRICLCGWCRSRRCARSCGARRAPCCWRTLSGRSCSGAAWTRTRGCAQPGKIFDIIRNRYLRKNIKLIYKGVITILQLMYIFGKRHIWYHPHKSKPWQQQLLFPIMLVDIQIKFVNAFFKCCCLFIR